MLSILIPVYNYDITSLVQCLYDQAIVEPFKFEIIVIDDCSSNKELIQKNDAILKHSGCQHIKLDKNIGRSKLRNLLAKKAMYDNLLFLDADTIPTDNKFMVRYLKHLPLTTDIIYGGIEYQKNKPNDDQILRWVYGNSRESLSVEERKKDPYISFLTLNFLIKKSSFDTIQFNEEIPNLRCEDTLFAIDAQKNQLSIAHINNPIIHLGLETNEIFFRKSLESIDVRKMFVKESILNPSHTRITKFASQIRHFRLQLFVILWYKILGKKLKKNILSRNPSMLFFDLYRLGYYFENIER